MSPPETIQQRDFFSLVDTSPEETPPPPPEDHPLFAKRVQELMEENGIPYDEAKQQIIAEDLETDKEFNWWQK